MKRVAGRGDSRTLSRTCALSARSKSKARHTIVAGFSIGSSVDTCVIYSIPGITGASRVAKGAIRVIAALLAISRRRTNHLLIIVPVAHCFAAA